MSKKLNKSKNNKNENTEERLLKIEQKITTSFQGPFPPPHILAQYDQILPVLANRIVKMAENQSKHRQKMEKEIIISKIKLASRGQIFAFLIAVIAMIATVTFAYLGQEVTATILGGATIISLVTLFIKGKSPKPNYSKKDNITAQNH